MKRNEPRKIGDEEVPNISGTIFLMVVFLMLIFGFWVMMYVELLHR